jgi:hypothetical protein
MADENQIYFLTGASQRIMLKFAAVRHEAGHDSISRKKQARFLLLASLKPAK